MSPATRLPKFRVLWEHIRGQMPKKGRGKATNLDPLNLPTLLKTALEALYGHYKQTFELMEKARIAVPPCFIVVCNNTSTSKLVYDYISGFHRENTDGSTTFQNGSLELFRNFDEYGNRYPRPRTLLIDSEQLESGDTLDKDFRKMAADEIDRFRREITERTGDRQKAENISDQELLREVMNTVGKPGRLGDSIRCVVSVSMLTEGWDANTVSHVLGVRAFGTQLLCEQVVGRALRRQSYDLNDSGSSTSSTRMYWAYRSTLPPSPWWSRQDRPERRFKSKQCGRNVTRLKFVSRALRDTGSSYPKRGLLLISTTTQCWNSPPTSWDHPLRGIRASSARGSISIWLTRET